MQQSHLVQSNGKGLPELMQVVSALQAKLEADKLADSGVQNLVTGELAQKLEAMQMEQSKMQAVHDQLQQHLSRSREDKLIPAGPATPSPPTVHKPAPGQLSLANPSPGPGMLQNGRLGVQQTQQPHVLPTSGAAQQMLQAGISARVKEVQAQGRVNSQQLASAQHARALNQPGDVSLHKAAQTGNLEEIKRLVALGRQLEGREGNRGQTPLHFASKGGSTAAAQLLLQLGSDMNARDKNFLTPLHWAGSMEMVEVLVKAGADPNVPDKLGSTPVHYTSVDPKKVAVLKKLLELGAEVNARNAYGRTPLHKAAEKGSLEAVQVLLACKADVNCRDQDGDTPLHCAAVNGHLPVVQALVAAGAVVSYKNKEGLSAVSMAGAGGRHPQVAKFLMKVSLKERPDQAQLMDGGMRTELVQHVKAMLRDLHLPKEIANKIAEYTVVSLKNGPRRSPREASPNSHSRGHSREERGTSRSHGDHERYGERNARYRVHDARDPRYSPHRQGHSREQGDRRNTSSQRRRMSEEEEMVERLSHLVNEWERTSRRGSPASRDVLTRQRSRDQDSDRQSVTSVRSHGSNSSRPPSVPRDTSFRHRSAPRDSAIREGRGRERSSDYRRDGSRDSRDSYGSRDSVKGRDAYEKEREAEHYRRVRGQDHHQSQQGSVSPHRRTSSEGREGERRRVTYADDRDSSRRREYREGKRVSQGSGRKDLDRGDRLTNEELRRLKERQYQKVVEKRKVDPAGMYDTREKESPPNVGVHRSPERVSPAQPPSRSPTDVHPALASAPMTNPFSPPQQQHGPHSTTLHTAPPVINFFSPTQLPPGTGMIFGASAPAAPNSYPPFSLTAPPSSNSAPPTIFSAPIAPALPVPTAALVDDGHGAAATTSSYSHVSLSPTTQPGTVVSGELRLPTPELKRTQETHVNKVARVHPLHTAPASMTITGSDSASLSSAPSRNDLASTAQSAEPIFSINLLPGSDQAKPSPDMLRSKTRATRSRTSPLDQRRGRRPTNPATPPKDMILPHDDGTPPRAKTLFASPPAGAHTKTTAHAPEPGASNRSHEPSTLAYTQLQLTPSSGVSTPAAGATNTVDTYEDSGPFGRVKQKAEMEAAGALFKPGGLMAEVKPSGREGRSMTDAGEVFTPGQTKKLNAWLRQQDGRAPNRSVSAPPSMPYGRLPSDGSTGLGHGSHDSSHDPSAPISVPGPRALGLMHSADGLPTVLEEGADDSVRWPKHLKIRTRPLSPEEEAKREERLKSEAASNQTAASPAGKGEKARKSLFGLWRASGKMTKSEETVEAPTAVDVPAPAAGGKTPVKSGDTGEKRSWWKSGRKKSAVSMDAAQGDAAAEAVMNADATMIHHSLPNPIPVPPQPDQRTSVSAPPARPAAAGPPRSPSADSWETMSNPEVITPGTKPPPIRYVWRSKSEERKRPSKVCCAAPVAQL